MWRSAAAGVLAGAAALAVAGAAQADPPPGCPHLTGTAGRYVDNTKLCAAMQREVQNWLMRQQHRRGPRRTGLVARTGLATGPGAAPTGRTTSAGPAAAGNCSSRRAFSHGYKESREAGGCTCEP